MTRIQRLTDLATKQGEASIHAVRTIRKFGDSVVEMLPVYLGDADVCGAPPDGEWKAGTEYNDARFSFFKRDQFTLDPVRMGVATRVPYRDNLGWAWVKTTIEFEMQGNNLLSTVQGRPPRQILDIDDPKDVAAVCDDIFDHLLSVFEDPVAHAPGAKQIKIGF